MTETIEKKCIAKGVKLTEQRRIIAKVMSDATDHPDEDEFDLDKTTTLNNLHNIITNMLA